MLLGRREDTRSGLQGRGRGTELAEKLGDALGTAGSSMALGEDCLVLEARQPLSHAFVCGDPAVWQPLF